MKKFLTVLLALSVVFTYSFSAVGTAFAATEYTLDDYSKALASEKAAQLTYLDKAKDQAIGLYKFDEDGFVVISGVKYMKAAIEAAAQKVIDKATTAMDEKINDVLNGTFPTTAAPDKTVVAEAAKVGSVGNEDVTIANNMKDALEDETDTLNKVQAPLTKAFVEGKLNVDLSKYNSVDRDYNADGEAVATGGVLTAVQAMQKAIDEAKVAIKTADKETADADKIAGYEAAKTAFDTAVKGIKTLEDEAYEDAINDGTVEGAVNAFAKMMIDDIVGVSKLNIKANMNADATEDWATAVTVEGLKDFWEADKTTNTKGKLFGVAIANIGKVTRTEVSAVNAAVKATVTSAKTPIVTYANGDASKVPNALSADAYTLLKNATKAAEVYADVVALGQKMKSEYMYGVKVYDDAKVDAAVKAAEKLVYKDLTKDFDDAKDYIEAAKDGSLLAENYEIVKFEKAIDAAAKKLYKEGVTAAKDDFANANPQEKVSYGDDKTAEADLVYLKGTYAASEGADWEKIAKQAVLDLIDAQSYEEINAIMAQAAADFGKLLTAADENDVNSARASYKQALVDYGALKKGLLDDTAYPDANVNAAVAQGQELIDKAITVAAVKAAYEQGKAIIDGLKTADELKAAKEAVEKQISELPYTAKLTVADKAAVVAAYKAYDAYMNMPGATEPANNTLLMAKYNKVNELAAKDIDAAAKAINDKIDALHLDTTPANWSDADVAAMAALKAEADAVKADAKALDAEISAVNKEHPNFLNSVTFNEVGELSAHDFAAAKAGEVERMLVKASNDGATVEEMKAALAAYEQLTDRQKYELDSTVLQYVKVINEKLIKEVKSFKIKTTTKRYTGSKMRVNWTVVEGNESAIDGYRIYYSTKKSNSGYKYLAKTTKKYINHTSIKKSVKKGTRVYYRVRAYVEIDGQRYFSDYSTVGNRIWK